MRWWPAVGLVALAACGGGDGAAPSTTNRLAPSQISASTVARPDTPPPCDADDLVWWTARAASLGTTSTAVVRVRNDGEAWCEVDIAGSPGLAPEAEPSVWLEDGEWADLIVGSDDGTCAPTVFDHAEVAVRDTLVAVPSIGVAECAPTIVAFYVVDPPEQPCGELDAIAVDSTIVVRNAGSTSCELGHVVRAAGAGAGASPGRSPGRSVDAAAVTALASGDVVAIETVPVGESCPEPPTDVTFTVAGAVPVDDASGCPVSGPARPWLADTTSASTSASTSGPATVADVLASLDPFG